MPCLEIGLLGLKEMLHVQLKSQSPVVKPIPHPFLTQPGVGYPALDSTN